MRDGGRVGRWDIGEDRVRCVVFCGGLGVMRRVSGHRRWGKWAGGRDGLSYWFIGISIGVGIGIGIGICIGIITFTFTSPRCLSFSCHCRECNCTAL